MATFPEARAAKSERLRREQRLFTPDRRGPKCPVCGKDTVAELVQATNDPRHPACAEPELMKADR